MTFKGAIRWSLRPKRVAVMIAKLLLAGSTDLAAQTAWQQVNSGTPYVSIETSHTLKNFGVPPVPLDAAVTWKFTPNQ